MADDSKTQISNRSFLSVHLATGLAAAGFGTGVWIMTLLMGVSKDIETSAKESRDRYDVMVEKQRKLEHDLAVIRIQMEALGNATTDRFTRTEFQSYLLKLSRANRDKDVVFPDFE